MPHRNYLSDEAKMAVAEYKFWHEELKIFPICMEFSIITGQ